MAFKGFQSQGRCPSLAIQQSALQQGLNVATAFNYQQNVYVLAHDSVLDVASIGDIQKILEDHFLVLTMLLLFMAGLIVIVGGLGLMTTMSIQVLECTREIGVMRAIGASSRQIMRMIRIEGLIIGLLSWAMAAVLALPLSRFVGDVFGRIFLKTTLDMKCTVCIYS